MLVEAGGGGRNLWTGGFRILDAGYTPPQCLHIFHTPFSCGRREEEEGDVVGVDASAEKMRQEGGGRKVWAWRILRCCGTAGVARRVPPHNILTYFSVFSRVGVDASVDGR